MYKKIGGVHEHVLIVERVLGYRPRRPIEIHHIDGDKHNNIPTNLVVCPNKKYHALLHARTRIVNMGGNPDLEKYCAYHDQIEPREEFSTKPSSYDGLHHYCRVGTNEDRQQRGLNRNKFNWKERLNQQYRRIKKTHKRRDITWLT